MLSSERYTHARAGLTWATQRGFVERATLADLEIFSSEQYKTQKALDNMEVNTESLPSDLPGLEIIHLSRTIDRSKPFVASLIGMPRATKTTALNILEPSDLFNPIYRVTFEEHYKDVKRELESVGNFSFPLAYEKLLELNELDYKEAVMELNTRKSIDALDESYAVFDRLSWTDLPFVRAHFLYGRYPPQTFVNSESQLSEAANMGPVDANLAVILCLTTPETTLERNDPHKIKGIRSSILNLPFLTTLYEQYLRYHYELLNYEQVFGSPRNFAFATVDTSGSLDESFRKIEGILNWTLIHTYSDQFHDVFAANKGIPK